MDERHTELAGLRTCLMRAAAANRVTIVFLHGYGMRAADLTPFAHSLGIPGAAYAFPEAPVKVSGGGYSWWSIDENERATRLLVGPRDLADDHPPDRPRARALIRELLGALRAQNAGLPVLLAGFSQGGMLACDTVLFESVSVAGLALLSASCVALDEWQPRSDRLSGLRAFVSHGRDDHDLAFADGQRLERFMSASGALVTWVPFAGGHEIPFPVWRQFRDFAHATAAT